MSINFNTSSDNSGFFCFRGACRFSWFFEIGQQTLFVFPENILIFKNTFSVMSFIFYKIIFILSQNNFFEVRSATE